MPSIKNAHLAAFAQASANQSLRGILRGLEKESLRITPTGDLAKTDHPLGLGSALKHPHITTDYSEALLEFITEPFSEISSLLQQLDDIHRFTYQELAKTDERLWPSSMPSHLPPDADIPVARYGSSNIGTMKTVYRVGLGHRYGRSMQTIAGVHYNFSMPDSFWRELQKLESDTADLQGFKTQRYFALIRNFRRYFWLLVYLFGSAPAVSNNFVEGRKHRLQPHGDDSQHLPLATSLRMGDLGYQSDAQQSLFVCYNNLNSYLRTLCGAITHPHPDYETIGIKDEQGQYKQLNTSLLQIENEFYSSIRPKRTTQTGETALQALRLRGVEYIEVRCVDLNPYEPLGVSAEQLRVIDAFLLACLLSDSPETSLDEYAEWLENQKRIVSFGRNPELRLSRRGEQVSFKEWATEILGSSLACAKLLDQANGGGDYVAAVNRQIPKLDNAALTPSARVLADMTAKGQSFFEHSLSLAEQHRQFFAEKPLPANTAQKFQTMATQSLAEQRQLEESPQIPFDQYLESYYRQYHSCSCAPLGDAEMQNTSC